MRSLPVLKGFPIDAVPVSPLPNDSKIYTAIRRRCVFARVCAGGRGQRESSQKQQLLQQHRLTHMCMAVTCAAAEPMHASPPPPCRTRQ